MVKKEKDVGVSGLAAGVENQLNFFLGVFKRQVLRQARFQLTPPLQSLAQMKCLHFFAVLFCFWWCTQAAPKRFRNEEPDKRLWWQVPRPKSKDQIEAEEELGQALRELFEKTKSLTKKA